MFVMRTRIDTVATQMMQKYDRNSSGAIDLPSNGNKNSDELQLSSGLGRNGRGMQDFLLRCDTNQDGKVTKEELAAGLKGFDKDGSGYLFEHTRNLFDFIKGRKPAPGGLDVLSQETGYEYNHPSFLQKLFQFLMPGNSNLYEV